MDFFYFHFHFFQMPFVLTGGGCCRCHNQWGKYGSVGSVVVGVHGVKTMTKTRKDEKTDLFVRYWFEFGQKSDDNDLSEWLFGKYLLKTRFVKVIRGFVYKITERKLWIAVCSSPDAECAVIHAKSEGSVFCLPATRKNNFVVLFQRTSAFRWHSEWSEMWQACLLQILSNLYIKDPLAITS